MSRKHLNAEEKKRLREIQQGRASNFHKSIALSLDSSTKNIVRDKAALLPDSCRVNSLYGVAASRAYNLMGNLESSEKDGLESDIDSVSSFWDKLAKRHGPGKSRSLNFQVDADTLHGMLFPDNIAFPELIDGYHSFSFPITFKSVDDRYVFSDSDVVVLMELLSSLESFVRFAKMADDAIVKVHKIAKHGYLTNYSVEDLETDDILVDGADLRVFIFDSMIWFSFSNDASLALVSFINRHSNYALAQVRRSW